MERGWGQTTVREVARRLRDGLDATSAVDMYAAVCDVEAYHRLTRRGWPPSRIRAWWTQLVHRELLERRTETP